jgi:hypothetical protein
MIIVSLAPRCARFAAVLVATLIPAIAAAQTEPPGDSRLAMQGVWEMSNAARDRRCLLEFRSEPAPGGFALKPDAACPTVFPSIKDMAAWSLGAKATLRLLDANSRALLELTEVESGMFEGERRGEGLFFLQSQAAANADVRVEQLFGDWTLTRGSGGATCRVTLSNELASVDDFKIMVQPGCDAIVAELGLATWRLQRSELLIAGKSGLWRFAEVDSVTWQRIPPGGETVQLVKK